MFNQVNTTIAVHKGVNDVICLYTIGSSSKLTPAMFSRSLAATKEKAPNNCYSVLYMNYGAHMQPLPNECGSVFSAFPVDLSQLASYMPFRISYYDST